jgi:iron complex outermembrane receptor protein
MNDEESCRDLDGGSPVRNRGAGRVTRASLLASSVWIGVFTASPIPAQPPTAAPPISAQPETPAQSPLEAIIVTAQRRAERLQDVPITVTDLSAEQLDRANVVSTSDIARLTPGLRYDTEGPFVEPTIRGIGTQLIGQTVGSNVGTYVDGFYLPSPLQGDFQLIDIDNI